MAPTWDDSMETGDSQIDDQHRRILGLIDELESAELADGTADTIYRLLGDVMDLTVTHFAMEEDLMIRVAYPLNLAEEMIQQHLEFTSYARLRVLEFRTGEDLSVIPLQVFLKNWLVGHEFGLDRRLVAWIKASSADLEQ